jgi:methyl-accepting chemotaxis protein
MKLGSKLLMAPLLTALVALSAGEINAVMMSRAAVSSQDEVQQRMEHFKTLSSTQAQLGQVHAGVYRTVALMASLDEAKVKSMRADLATQLNGVQRTLTAGVEASGSDEQLRAAVSAADAETSKYLKTADAAIDLASVDPNTGIAAMQDADAAYANLAKTVGGMVARIDALTVEGAAASSARSDRIHLILAMIGLLAAGAAVAVSWQMQRKLVSDLGHAARVADTVAGGDLTVQAHSERADELGDLLRALDRMAGQLNESLQTVMDSSQSIQTASSEIASGNLDLSQRTEQAASRLQQTASAMTQLTGTVRQSAESAATANQLASTAAAVAQRGGEVVHQVVKTMDEINASSNKISDIIGVIDGIAFQTNILALNAAVEAARAGEQGRGFAVVASEVRSLAQRSAEAAKEIKGLIGSSVAKVEAGARLVQDAGTTMSEIVASVGKVSDVIGEIRASTVEQSEGIGSVNGAVVQLDQMTQQNAALVEESAAAAESLRDQARKLAGLVSGFTLSSQQHATAPPAARAAIAIAAAMSARPSPSSATPSPKTNSKPRPVTANADHNSSAPVPTKRPPASSSSVQPTKPAPSLSSSDGDWESF